MCAFGAFIKQRYSPLTSESVFRQSVGCIHLISLKMRYGGGTELCCGLSSFVSLLCFFCFSFDQIISVMLLDHISGDLFHPGFIITSLLSRNKCQHLVARQVQLCASFLLDKTAITRHCSLFLLQRADHILDTCR